MGAGSFFCKSAPGKSKTIQEIAFAALHKHSAGSGSRSGSSELLRSTESEFPVGTYIAVVDIRQSTGEIKVRRFVAVDDAATLLTR